MNTLVKRFLIFVSPFAIIATLFLFLYVKADPYRDFGPYPNYSWNYNFQILGDLSTKKLLYSKRNYNSFVFGSSRSLSAHACYLNARLPKSKFFHYASWNETIGGIENRLKLLDSLGMPLKNVFIFLDPDCIFLDQGRINSMDHWLLTGESKMDYLIKHLKVFADNMDQRKLDILINGVLNKKIQSLYESDPINNDASHVCTKKVFSEYGNRKSEEQPISSYDPLNPSVKHNILSRCKVNQISPEEEKSIKTIVGILKKHKSRAWFLISPLFDQMKFSKTDSLILRKHIGRRLYDFSGVNRFTRSSQNYHSDAKRHYLPHVGKEMLDEVLASDGF